MSAAVLLGLLIAIATGMVLCVFWIGAAFLWPTRRNTQPFESPGQKPGDRRSTRHSGMS